MTRAGRRLRALVLLGTFLLIATLVVGRDGSSGPGGPSGDDGGRGDEVASGDGSGDDEGSDSGSGSGPDEGSGSGDDGSGDPDSGSGDDGDGGDGGDGDGDGDAGVLPIDPELAAAVAPEAPEDVPAPLPAPGPDGAPVVTRVETADPVVFVTIDDGFTRSSEAAEVLDELGIPVTAFLLDEPALDDAAWFADLPEVAVGAHGRSHADLRGQPEEVQREDVCGNADTLGTAFGRRPMFFRPPYGNHDAGTRRAAAACGMAAVVLWEVSVESGDLRYRTVPELRAGDIVLLHFRPELAGELRMLAHQVEAAGLRFGALQDYLAPARTVDPRHPVLGPPGGAPRGS